MYWASTWKQRVSVIGPGLTETHVSIVDLDLVGIALYPLQKIEIGRHVFHVSWRNEEWGGPKVFTGENPFVAGRGSVAKDRKNGTRVPGVTKISAQGRKSLFDDRMACKYPDFRGHRPVRCGMEYDCVRGHTRVPKRRPRFASRRPSGCTMLRGQ